MTRRKADDGRRTLSARPPADAGFCVGEWVEDGLCRGKEEIFFSPFGPDWTEAKRICDDCPVRLTCLQYALDTKQLHGTWGGANQLELRFFLAVNASETPKRYTYKLFCPFCHRRDVETTAPAPRSGLPELCACLGCGFTWERVYIPKRGRRRAA